MDYGKEFVIKGANFFEPNPEGVIRAAMDVVAYYRDKRYSFQYRIDELEIALYGKKVYPENESLLDALQRREQALEESLCQIVVAAEKVIEWWAQDKWTQVEKIDGAAEMSASIEVALRVLHPHFLPIEEENDV